MKMENDKNKIAENLPQGITHYNPVTVDSTAGLIFMFILAAALLAALLRSEARNRELMAKLAQLNQK